MKNRKIVMWKFILHFSISKKLAKISKSNSQGIDPKFAYAQNRNDSLNHFQFFTIKKSLAEKSYCDLNPWLLTKIPLDCKILTKIFRKFLMIFSFPTSMNDKSSLTSQFFSDENAYYNLLFMIKSIMRFTSSLNK